MYKEFIYNEQAWAKLDSGAKQVYDAVKVTLGPRGHNVVIGHPYGSPLITKDGVTVAKEITLKDPFENMGAQLIKEIASKTNDSAGDGTTTSTVLGYEIFKEGLKSITKGINPAMLKRGIDLAIKVAIVDIASNSKPVKKRHEVAQVATISANNDVEIGDLIAEAMDKVGKDGVITVEESNGIETTLSVVEGMQFDNGYISPYMVTDQERMEAVLEKPHILILDKKVSSVKELVPLLTKIQEDGNPLLIIAEDVEGDALQTLVLNKARGALSSIAVKAPAFGDTRKSIMEDIAIVTGGVVISEDKGHKIEETTLEMLGSATRVTITKDETIIVEGKGTSKDINIRVANIRREMDRAGTQYESEQLQERLAKLSGGVAVIKAGAATETELKEKKLRIEDALSATRAAVEDGIVAGGGVTLIRAISKVAELESSTIDVDIRSGIAIVKKSLESPLSAIAYNAGQSGEVVVEKVKELTGNIGYNALKLCYEDLLKAGVVDPLKVTKSALQNAASIASMLLTTSVLIADGEDNSGIPKPPQMYN